MRWLTLILTLFSILLRAEEDLVEEESPPVIIELPNPNNLQAQWWDYFSGDKETVENHIEEEIQLLNALKLQVGYRSEISAIIDNIIDQFDTYLNLRPIHNIVFFEIHLKEHYSLSDFHTIAIQIYQAENRVRAEKLQAEISSNNIDSDEKHIDALFIKYRDLQDNSPEKLFQGLRIMSKKISLEIERHELSLVNASLEEHEKELDDLEKLLNHASTHIEFTDEDIKSIDNRIEQYQGYFQAVYKQIATAQRTLATQANQTPEHRQALQELITALVWKGEVKIEITAMQIEKLFALIKMGKYKGTLSEITQQTDKWEESIATVERELEDWRETTKVEMERSAARNNRDALLLSTQNTIDAIFRLKKEIFYAELMLDVLNQLVKTNYNSFSHRVKHGWHRFVGALSRTDKWYNKRLFHIGKSPISLQNLLNALIVLVIAYLFAFAVRLLIRRFVNTHPNANKAGFYSLGRLIFYVIVIIGLFAGISALGVDFTAFAFIAGALTLGIGFGMQSIFNNFIAGILLLIEKTVRIGDIIQISSGDTGVVKEIRVRTTLMQSFEGLDILIPNTEIISAKLINWNLSSENRELRIPFSIDVCPDKEKLKQEIIAAVENIPTTIKNPPPDLRLTKIDNEKLEFELVVWVNDCKVDVGNPNATASNYLWAIQSYLVGLR